MSVFSSHIGASRCKRKKLKRGRDVLAFSFRDEWLAQGVVYNNCSEGVVKVQCGISFLNTRYIGLQDNTAAAFAGGCRLKCFFDLWHLICGDELCGLEVIDVVLEKAHRNHRAVFGDAVFGFSEEGVVYFFSRRMDNGGEEV